MKRVVARMRMSVSVAAIETWKEAVIENKTFSVKGNRVIGKLRHCGLGAAFERWRESTVLGTHDRAKLGRVLRRMQNIALSQAFDLYQSHVAAIKELRSWLTVFVLRIINTRVARTFGCWREKADFWRHARLVQRKVLLRMNESSQAKALDRWRDVIIGERALRNKAARISNQTITVQLRQTWLKWTVPWYTGVQKKEIVIKALSKHIRRKVHSAFETWLQHATSHKYRIRVMQKTVTTLRIQQLSRLWHKWRINAQESVRHRRVMGTIIR
eukprot:473107-Rhodomonas_salina.1